MPLKWGSKTSWNKTTLTSSQSSFWEKLRVATFSEIKELKIENVFTMFRTYGCLFCSAVNHFVDFSSCLIQFFWSLVFESSVPAELNVISYQFEERRIFVSLCVTNETFLQDFYKIAKCLHIFEGIWWLSCVAAT